MAYIGFGLGLFSELVKLAGLVCGFFVSFRYYQQLGDVLANRTFLSIEWASALVMAVLVVGVYFGVTRVLRLLEKLVQVSFHNRLNEVGGLLLGSLRGALVTSVILVICRQLPSPYLSASIEERSLAGRTLSRVAPAVYDAVTPPLIRSIKRLQTPSK